MIIYLFVIFLIQFLQYGLKDNYNNYVGNCAYFNICVQL